MRDGANGLSSMLAMPAWLAGHHRRHRCPLQNRGQARRHLSSHIRNEGTGVVDAVKEAIAIGERAGVPVDIIHLKIADQRLWGRMNELIALIDAARTRGVNVQAHVYPYTPRQQQSIEHQFRPGRTKAATPRCSNA